MAKRFIDTDLFKKPLVRGLEGAYKTLWVYLICNCDHAGIWVVDFEIASIYCGSELNPSKAVEAFQDEIVILDKGKTWFIPGFIDFQYGWLKENNRAHASVINILKKKNLLEYDESQGAYKPLACPLQGGKDMDKELDKDKDLDKDRGGCRGGGGLLRVQKQLTQRSEKPLPMPSTGSQAAPRKATNSNMTAKSCSIWFLL